MQREKEKEKERGREREKETHKQRDRHAYRQTQRERLDSNFLSTTQGHHGTIRERAGGGGGREGRLGGGEGRWQGVIDFFMRPLEVVFASSPRPERVCRYIVTHVVGK